MELLLILAITGALSGFALPWPFFAVMAAVQFYIGVRVIAAWMKSRGL